MLTKLVWRKSCLGEENKRDQFLVCAKRTVAKSDLTRAVLPMKLSPPGCTMVTFKLETLLYMSTPEGPISEEFSIGKPDLPRIYEDSSLPSFIEKESLLLFKVISILFVYVLAEVKFSQFAHDM